VIPITGFVCSVETKLSLNGENSAMIKAIYVTELEYPS